MKIRLLVFAIALAVGVTITPSNAFAKGFGHDGNHADRDHDRGGHATPPGWSHGKKTGWRGGDEPPGLAKKHHDFDRDHDRDRHVYRANHRRYRTYHRRPTTTRTTTTTTTAPGANPLPTHHWPPKSAATTTTYNNRH